MTGEPARFLVVLDADSTLIRNEVIELIADEAGRGAEVAAATEAAMRGEVDFATSLRSRVTALTGVPVAAFARVHRAILDKNVVLEPGATVGVDRSLDIARGFTVTDSGITVVGKNARVAR